MAGEFKKVRHFCGGTDALFGGYVAKYHKTAKDDSGLPKFLGYREVSVWLPHDTADDDCGPGTDKVVAAVAEKAGVPVGDVRETWRY